MPLARDLSGAFHSVALDGLSDTTVSHARTILIDALACIFAGERTEIVEVAKRAVGHVADDGPAATILPQGPHTGAAAAALINGGMLRSLDLLDVFVAVDVSHPSEAIPAALACAEAYGASGREFLETVVAALELHAHLASVLPLHSNRLHHVGNAAWVVPLVAGRLMNLGTEGAANALNLAVAGMFVPEGFSRGQLANVKALAYPTIARHAIELAELSRAGLRAQAEGCEEVLDLFGRATGHQLTSASALVPGEGAQKVESITLKAYPAQYALQPIIAAGAGFNRDHPGRAADIVRITVRAARRTVERTADRDKFQPKGREAADHSLPFCLAAALLDGGLTPHTLARERWGDSDVMALIDRTEVEPWGEGDGYAIGRQEIVLTFADGSSLALDCDFPGSANWHEIARTKLRDFAGGAAEGIVGAVETIEHEDSVLPLIKAVRARGEAAAESAVAEKTTTT